MYDTKYDNGVLVCSIHETPISKQHGRFFCIKCQRDKDLLGRIENGNCLLTDCSQCPLNGKYCS